MNEKFTKASNVTHPRAKAWRGAWPSLALLAVVAGYGCSDTAEPLPPTVDPGAGGAGVTPPPSAGGTGQTTGAGGTGGQAPGVGGSDPGVGGSDPGVGGSDPGVGGSDPGVGGSDPGVGGSDPGAGGSAPVPTAMPRACGKPEGNPCHMFIANNNSANRILLVDEFDGGDEEPVWDVGVGCTGVNCARQIEVIHNPEATGFPLLNIMTQEATPRVGNAFLISRSNGFQERDLADGGVLREVTGFSGVTGAYRMPDGTTALGTGNNTIRIVAAEGGAEVRSFSLPGSGDLRTIHFDGTNFWYGRQNNIFAVNPQGQEQWRGNIPSGGKAYAVFPVEPGTLNGAWATTGAPSTVGLYGAQSGQGPTMQLGGKPDHGGLGLDFFSGFRVLSNGNVLAANWLGHVGSPGGNVPHLVEFTREGNELAWRWGNQGLARQITNVIVLDEYGGNMTAPM